MNNESFYHSAKGSHWTKKNHKYIRKEGNRYIYDNDGSGITVGIGHKLVKKNPVTGEREKSYNTNVRQMKRKSVIERNKIRKDSEEKHAKFISDTKRNHYNFLKGIDDDYYKSVNSAKKMENPEELKKEFNQSKKLVNKTLDMAAKEIVDDSLKSKIAKKRISDTKKLLNSKLFDKMTDFLSKIGSKLIKEQNKSYIKKLDKERKEFKKQSNDSHQKFIREADRSYRNFWK